MACSPEQQPIVEATIDEYINKYSFPMRLNRAHLAMTAAIECGMQEAELIKQLEIDEHALSILQSEIHNLKTRRDKGLILRLTKSNSN
ncbi:hypothetical protein J4731_22415 [Providencia rettgeri]|nr:hypothetical protein [Providencia rettgeri]